LIPIKPPRPLAAALCLLAGCGGNPPRPNFTGKWALAPEKCSFQIPAPTASSLSIEHRDPQITLHRTTVFKDAYYRETAPVLGYNWQVSLIADGRPVWERLANGDTRVIKLEWKGDDLELSLTILNGNGVIEDDVSRFRLAPDGRSITVAERLGRLDNRWVYEKQ
jgi:hypothetical protein